MKYALAFVIGPLLILCSACAVKSVSGEASKAASRSDQPDQIYLDNIMPIWRARDFHRADEMAAFGYDAHARGEVDIHAADLLADVARAQAKETGDGEIQGATPRAYLNRRARGVLLDRISHAGPFDKDRVFDEILPAIEWIRLAGFNPGYSEKPCNCHPGQHAYRTGDEEARLEERLKTLVENGNPYRGDPVSDQPTPGEDEGVMSPESMKALLEEISPWPHSPVSWKVARWICGMEGWPQPSLLPRARNLAHADNRPMLVHAPENDVKSDVLYDIFQKIEYPEDASLAVFCMSHGTGRDFLFILQSNGTGALYVEKGGIAVFPAEVQMFRVMSLGYLMDLAKPIMDGLWPDDRTHAGWSYPGGSMYRVRRTSAEGNRHDECSAGYDEEINKPGLRLIEPAFPGHRIANFAAQLAALAALLRENPDALAPSRRQ